MYQPNFFEFSFNHYGYLQAIDYKKEQMNSIDRYIFEHVQI